MKRGNPFPKAYVIVVSSLTYERRQSLYIETETRDFQMMFPRHFGFAGKKHLPMLGITRTTYYPHTFLGNFWRMREWRMVDYNSGYLIVEKGSHSADKMPHYVSL